MRAESSKEQGAADGTRPKLGFFKYSCDAGCEFQFFHFQDAVAETLEIFDIEYCVMAKSGGREYGPFDLALVEGTITESWQVDELKKVRKVSRLLVPIGSCAINGGIPAIKNRTNELEVQQRVYENTEVRHSIRAAPIDAYVKVDGYIRGCPPSNHGIRDVLTSVLMGVRPGTTDHPVCHDCKANGYECVLVTYKMPCMGPVVSEGCGALCPSRKRACYACYGPFSDANAPALARTFEQNGLSAADIVRRFSQFGEGILQFRKGAEPYE